MVPPSSSHSSIAQQDPPQPQYGNRLVITPYERDRHLFDPGPKRLLALDGGGVRGAITVAFLQQIELVLRKHLGKDEVYLGDWFDLVGGTSTGSIIAGAVALGYTTSDILRFYVDLAPKVFRRPFWRIMGLQAKFDAAALRQQIEGIVGGLTLDTDELITGLGIVTKRIGTGSHRDRVIPDELGMGRTAKLAFRALTSLMNDAQTFVLQQMQYLGECPAPWTINSEIGSLVGDSPPHGKLFRFLRYDVRLELPWIEQELGPRVEQEFGRKLTADDVVRMRSMDDPTIIPDIYKLARIAAEIQVKPEHWVGELPRWCDGTQPSAKTRPHLPPTAPLAQPSA